MVSLGDLSRVLIADGVDASCRELLKNHGLEVTTATTKVTPQHLREYDCLVVRSQTRVTERLLGDALDGPDDPEGGGGGGHRRERGGLRVIVRAGTGLDNVDLQAATSRGILVLNTPGGNSTSAAELTCALIMALARNVVDGCRQSKEGRWDRRRLIGEELSGKCLAVVGLGRIGREVAARMAAFRCRVVGFDPWLSADAEADLADTCPGFVRISDLRQLCSAADYITVHTPLVPETTGLLDEEALFGWCKAGVRVVNCARGGIVDEAALLKAVEAGRCAGAALDVFTEEPPPPDHPVLSKLIAHPRVIATPHLGASTVEAQRRVAVEAAHQILALARPDTGYRLSGVANADWLMSGGGCVEGGLRLAKVTGRVVAALLACGSVEAPVELALVSSGGGGGRGLGAAFLEGLLTGGGGRPGPPTNGVNMISAPAEAARRGIPPPRVTVASRPAQRHPPRLDLELTLTTRHRTHTLLGSERDGESCLVSIDGCVFSPPVPLDKPTILFATSEPSDHSSLLARELADIGVTMVYMTLSSDGGGRSRWIALQTDRQVEIKLDPISFIYVQI